MADNYAISDLLSLLAKLTDIHEENSFRSKSYSAAAFTVEKLPTPLADMDRDKIFSIKGIGESSGKKILEAMDTGHIKALDDLIAKTPKGVLEMLQIKGLGPKKIRTIWKEMEIESIGELLYACQENRLMLFKGFGEKTQKNVAESIEFYFRSQGHYLYAEIEAYALTVQESLANAFPSASFELAGGFRRQQLVLEKLEWVTTLEPETLDTYFTALGFTNIQQNTTTSTYSGTEKVPLQFRFCSHETFIRTRFISSCSAEFLSSIEALPTWKAKDAESEEALFSSLGLHLIPAPMRERPETITLASQRPLPDLIQPSDVKAIIHSHSNWSDGMLSLADMAKTCMGKGFEYLVISDHSRSAFYANGLSVERIREQHLQIDELNQKLAPFRIFKSIECDILNDGSLDYPDDVLSTFDLVITSVHSNLKMSEEKAMQRLMGAIHNPHTTILGHMTGRLLLSRSGYPVDHRAVIDACASQGVCIEINAHPRRLDIDWSWIPYAMEKGVMLSINPDAHAAEGFDDIRFGVLAAQKGGLTKDFNLSSLGLPAFEAFIKDRKKKKGI
jgi:DNA polymerase (family 10)